jgi:hypothetical protein
MTTRLSIKRCPARLSLCVLTLAVVVACGPLRRGSDQAPATLIFTNGSLEQATVYITGAGLDAILLGAVMAGRTDTLTVPAGVATRGTLNIVARLLASPGLPQTGPVVIHPGQEYELRLPPNTTLISFLPSGP